MNFSPLSFSPVGEMLRTVDVLVYQSLPYGGG